MTWAFTQSAIDMYAPDYGKTHFGPVGGVFILGVGLLVLGIPVAAIGAATFSAASSSAASPERAHRCWRGLSVELVAQSCTAV